MARQPGCEHLQELGGATCACSVVIGPGSDAERRVERSVVVMSTRRGYLCIDIAECAYERDERSREIRTAGEPVADRRATPLERHRESLAGLTDDTSEMSCRRSRGGTIVPPTQPPHCRVGARWRNGGRDWRMARRA
jgi:hypothetical protein